MIVPTKIALDTVKAVEQHLTTIEAATLALDVFTTCKRLETIGEIEIEIEVERDEDETVGER